MKEFALQEQINKFIPLTRDPYRQGRQTFLTELPSLPVYPFPLQVFQIRYKLSLFLFSQKLLPLE